MAESKRSHPPALRNTVRKTLLECDVKNKSILLGLSGGSDSMALLHVLSTLKNEFGYQLFCCGVNHNLREEAQKELDIARDFCYKLGITFYQKDIYIEGKPSQDKARNLRYKALRELKEHINADYICTAHHFEDKAETVLIRIIRGTSVSGLDVLNTVSSDLIRPMIRAKKRDVMLHISRNNIPYSDDPSNKKTEVYLRSKVRYEVLPLLAQINPNICDVLCALSESAKDPEISGKKEVRKQKKKEKQKCLKILP